MLHATFSDLRHRAKRYFDAVENGETVEVTRKGKPIARVIPLRSGDMDLWKRSHPIKVGGVPASRRIIREREEGF